MQRIPEFIGNHLLLVAAFVVVLILLILSEVMRRRGAPKVLSPELLVQKMNAGEVSIVDIRGNSDFRKGHILGANHLTADQLSGAADRLKGEGNPVVICCATGMHGARAAATLQAAGIDNVAHLRGGIAAWRDAKLPLTRSK